MRHIQLPINGLTINLEHECRGYYLGEIRVGNFDVPFHVEAIEVISQQDKTATIMLAKNTLFQNRIDSWLNNNDHEIPRLVEHYCGTKYFIHIEPYAA